MGSSLKISVVNPQRKDVGTKPLGITFDKRVGEKNVLTNFEGKM